MGSYSSVTFKIKTNSKTLASAGFVKGFLRSTISSPVNPEENPRVKAVFEDMHETRGKNFINNLWHYLAFDPALLEATWRDVNAVIAKPSSLDTMTKELVYAAVSLANSCDYCIHSLNATARSNGMTDEQYAEFLAIVSLAGFTNHLLNGKKVPVDPEFDCT
jgi:AhpD family alkylhydroperoxidase